MRLALTRHRWLRGILSLLAAGSFTAATVVVAVIGSAPPRIAEAAGECPADSAGVVTWTYSAGKCTGVFAASTTWNVPAGLTSFDYLVVGGGGGGATGSNALGGNGGTVSQATGRSITGGTSVTVTVGAGGGSGATGGQSSLTWTSNSITAAGGAGGARSGSGANGTSSSITGSSVVYGSSGGQGSDSGPVRPGGSGAGAGAQGPVGNCSGGVSGTANRGGGGGGGANCDYGGFTIPTVSGSGGSGLVVVQYVAFAVSSFTTSQSSPTNSTSFSYTLTFNSNVDATTLTAGDLSNAGTAGCTFSTSPTVGTTATFTVTVSGCGQGTVIPTLAVGSVTSSGGVTGPGTAAAGSTVTIDTTAPSAPAAPDLAQASDSGSSDTDNVTSDTTPTVSASGGSTGDTVTVSAVNGGTTKTCTYVVPATSCDLPTLTEGTWSVSATLTDAAGNVSSAGPALSLSVDTTAPSAPAAPDLVASSDLGSSDTDNVTSDTTPAMSLVGGTNAGDTVLFTAVNGATTKTCSYTVGSATSCDLPTLSAGTWSVTAKVTDPAGNQSTAGPALSLSVDTTAPSAPAAPDLVDSSDLGSSSTDNLTSDATPSFSATGGSDGDTVTVSAVNGGTTKTCNYVKPATSCDLPTLTDGTWSVSSTVTDPAGNTSAAGSALSLSVDTTAPSAPAVPDLAAVSDSGTSNSDDNTSDNTPTVSVTGGAAGETTTVTATKGGTSVTCSFTHPATSCDLPALSDGTWSVSAARTDAAGNTSAAGPALSLSVDTTAPSAPAAPDLADASDTGTSSSDNVTSDTTPTLTLAGTTTGDTVLFTATKGGTTKTCSYTVGAASSCDLSGLTDGTWSVTAQVTDAAGNQSSAGAELSLLVDTTAPSAPSAPDLSASSDSGSSSTDDVTSDTTPAVSASGGSSGDTVTFTATNGSTSVSCSYVVGTDTSCDLPTLSDGTWSVSATLRDPAGNTSAAGPSLSMTVDSSGPVSPGAPDLAASSDTGTSSTDDLTSDTTPTVSVSGGSSGDRVTLTATKGSTSLSCSYTVGSATSCDLPALTDGTWSVSGAITDPAGNTSAAGTPFNLVVDTTAPTPAQVDLLAVSDTGTSSTDDLTSDTTPTVSVPDASTGDSVTVTARNGSTSVSCSYTVGSATSCDLPALTDGTWSLSASVTDAAGNTGYTSTPLPLTVDSTPPAAPGQPDLFSASDSGASNMDDLTNDATPTMGAFGGSTGDTMTFVATNGSTSVSCSYVLPASYCDLPTLTDGTWSVTARLTDPAGNVSAVSAATALTVDTAGPTVPTRPDLVASSDTGVSSTDDVTADSTPTVNVPGVEAGSTVVVTARKGATSTTCTYVASPAVGGCTLPELADGTWTVTAVATDTAGNAPRTPQSLSLVIDTSKPFENVANNTATGSTTSTTTTTAPQRGTTATTSPRTTTAPQRGAGPSTTASRTNSTTRTTVVRSTTSTSTTTTTVPPSPIGTPDLRTPADTGANAGDNLTGERNPVVGLDGLSNGDRVSVVAVKAGVTVKCAYVVGESDGCRLEGLEDGDWTVNAAVVDLAGNRAKAPRELQVTVDSTPPVSSLSARSIDDVSDGSTFIEVSGAVEGETVVVTATANGATVTCSFVAVAATSGCLLEGVEPGAWTVSAVALDGAGNSGVPSPPFGIVRAAAGGDDTGGPAPDVPSNEDEIRLLASALALLALRRRRRDDDSPERLSSDEREASGVAEYSAGTGSGGLDRRDDLWVPPNSTTVDDGFCRGAERSARFSPVVARSLDDGSYLRALFGIAWPLLPLVGAVLGALAAADTGFDAVMPALGLFVTVMVIGTLDAFAGLVGAVTYGVALLVGGGLHSADSVRGLLGIAGPMFLVGLVASATRPFRRTDGEHRVWNRTVDFVLIPLIGAWAAGSMFSAIPYLSGYEVAWSGRVGTVEVAALVTLIVRFGLENLARLAVATRLEHIENEELPEPSDVQKSVSRVVRTAVFAFVAVVFIGANGWLAAGALMFLVPKIVENHTDRFPNNELLHRWLPRNLVRTVTMLLVMLWWGLLLDGAFDTNTVQWAFVLMSIPGLALGVLDWFAREGRGWPTTLLSRVLGVLTLALGVVLVRGWWP